jgi:ribosomal-protein-alanine N-acetyltransferase
MNQPLPFLIEPMRLEDISEVSRVERRCFSNPWPTAAYRRELRNLEHNYYVVLRGSEPALRVGQRGAVDQNGDGRRGLRSLGLLSLARRNQPALSSPPPIVGFAGMWQLYDEAHITTIGVDLPVRGRGLGEALLLRMLDESVRRGANMLTLEVRISNEGAIRLYEKYSFSIHGVRPRYYSDNGEDAYLMWSPSLRDTGYLEQVAALRSALVERLSGILAIPESAPVWASRRIDDRNVS